MPEKKFTYYSPAHKSVLTLTHQKEMVAMANSSRVMNTIMGSLYVSTCPYFNMTVSTTMVTVNCTNVVIK